MTYRKFWYYWHTRNGSDSRNGWNTSHSGHSGSWDRLLKVEDANSTEKTVSFIDTNGIQRNFTNPIPASKNIYDDIRTALWNSSISQLG